MRRDIEDCDALIKTYDLSPKIAEALVREAIRYHPAQNDFKLREWQDHFEEIFDVNLATPFTS